MGSGRESAILSTVLLSAVLAFSSMPAGAVTPANGAYWTYDMTASLEVLGFVANVSGSVTYSFEGQHALSFSGSEYIVNIMRMSGSLAGTVRLTGQVNASASFAVEGVQYEDSASAGVIERNITFIGSVTFPAGAVSLTNSFSDTEVVLTVPPAISGFDPSDISLGDSWTRAVSETRTHAISQDQLPLNHSVSWHTATYAVQVAAAAGEVDAPAGSFSAVLVTASDDANETQQLWWSSEANCFVKQLEFENGSSSPALSLELSSFGSGRVSVSLLVPIAGLSMLAIAVIVLVIEVMRRRGQAAQAPPKEAPPPQASPDAGTGQHDPKR